MGQHSRMYTDRRWQKKRRAQLDAEPLCRICGAMGRTTPATVADHIKPHRGDLDLFWCGDLQSLCATCHNTVKQDEEAGRGPRGCGLDGLPLDQCHAFNR
jgi:5-methylcytosine-specific restriction protein A